MTRFQVDSEAVLTATGAIRSSIDRVQSETSALHGQLAALQNSWSGQAAVAFQSLFQHWRTAELQMQESLAEISQALNFAGQQYADTEAANARLFSR